jgi:cytochrome c oxidase subunit 3
MATLTIVFSMLLSSYLIGRNEPGWQALPQLNILWLNTLWLILSSVMLEWSRRLANQSQTTSSSIGSTARIALLAAGAFSLFFLMGQWLAWQELDRAGFFLGAHLSSSFFFLLTGLHGLHLIGGLVAWGWATLKISLEKDSLALGRIELCALYWHFLLLVWLVMFGLLWLAK